MRATIDRAGRVVIPKALRESLGLQPGQMLDLTVRDGALELEPAPTAMHLEDLGRGTVAVPEVELPPLSADLVRETLEQVRR